MANPTLAKKARDWIDRINFLNRGKPSVVGDACRAANAGYPD